MRFNIREATAADRAVLENALLMAVNWDASRPALAQDEAMADAAIAHYVDGWQRPADGGVIAEDETGTAMGAAWWRYFPWDDLAMDSSDPMCPRCPLR